MKKATLYIFLMSLMLVLWNTYIIKPVKIIAVFVHDVGHFLVALVFDSRAAVLKVSLDHSLHSVTSTGVASFFIASGGYIMSLIFAILVLRIRKPNVKRYFLGILSSLALLSLIYVPKVPTTFLYIVIFSVIVIVVYMLDNDKIFEYCVDIIGTSSITYCIYETLMKAVISKVDILKGIVVCGDIATDAEVLYKITGVPSIVWAFFWFFVSLGVVIFCMSVKQKRKY